MTLPCKQVLLSTDHKCCSEQEGKHLEVKYEQSGGIINKTNNDRVPLYEHRDVCNQIPQYNSNFKLILHCSSLFQSLLSRTIIVLFHLFCLSKYDPMSFPLVLHGVIHKLVPVTRKSTVTSMFS